MYITLLDTLVCVTSVALLIGIYFRKSAKPGASPPYPPGPPGLPLLGNAFEIPYRSAWLTYKQWSRTYSSDVIHLNIVGTNVIVLNSLRAAIDLFDRRSTLYNDRPYMTMLNDLIGWGWAMAFVPYGDRWRDMRRASHQQFGIEASKAHRDTQQKSARELLRRLLHNPEGFMDHLRHMAGRTIMRTAYGIDIMPADDPYIEIAEKSLQALSAATNAGAYLVDNIPFLKHIPEWFPGAHFQTEARVWRPSVFEMLHKPFNYVKSGLAEGQVHHSAATSLLDGMVKNSRDPEYMESVVRATLGSMYAGGADTTVSALGSFILAMILYPEIQKKARQELDSLLSCDRLPEFSDRGSLPYIDAIVNESLRWHPVVPLDIPHRLTADDVYEGYFIPAGSVIVANSWAVLHDEEAYSEPSKFDPDRYFKDGMWDPSVRDPSVAAFGFGRRICPGRFMAKDSMWIAIASILHCFEIAPAIGEDGKPILPKEEYAAGLVSYPLPFKCIIKPRSNSHITLILDTLHEEQ